MLRDDWRQELKKPGTHDGRTTKGELLELDPLTMRALPLVKAAYLLRCAEWALSDAGDAQHAEHWALHDAGDVDGARAWNWDEWAAPIQARLDRARTILDRRLTTERDHDLKRRVIRELRGHTRSLPSTLRDTIDRHTTSRIHEGRLITETRPPGVRPARAGARPRGAGRPGVRRRPGASSSSSSADPGGEDGEPEPPGLRLWWHPRFGSCTPKLLRLLLGAGR